MAALSKRVSFRAGIGSPSVSIKVYNLRGGHTCANNLKTQSDATTTILDDSKHLY